MHLGARVNRTWGAKSRSGRSFAGWIVIRRFVGIAYEHGMSRPGDTQYAEAGMQETFNGLSHGMMEALDFFLAYQGQYSVNQVENTFTAGLAYWL